MVSGAESFAGLRDYAKHLIKQFDDNQDGVISFEELCRGLVSLGINLSVREMLVLMKKIDLNRDGHINDEELYKAMKQSTNTIPQAILPQVMDQTIKKIASGADDFSNMKEYAQNLIKKFDRNSDGIISFKELC